MKRLVLLILFLIIASAAEAESVVLLWDVQAPTTSTDIEQMVCTGTGPYTCAAWTLVKNVITASAECVPVVGTNPVISHCTTSYTAPAGFVHFRFKHKTPNGDITRADAGPWVNDAWKLTAPINVGAQ